MNEVILKAENIFYQSADMKSYSSPLPAKILKNVSFNVNRGSVLGITGESGSGKTTLAKIIAGIFLPTSGSINYYFQKDWTHSKSKPVQILFQNDGELINPFRRVSDILKDVFEIKHNKNSDYSKEILEHFDLFELNPDLLSRKGFQLSGGEQQRIALARIVAVEPEILLLDEPFSSQDIEAQLNIIKLIQRIKDKLNLTVIIVTHDLKIINKLCDTLIIMKDGEIIESGFAKSIISDPQNSHTKFLLKAQTIQLTKSEIHSFQKKDE